MTREEAEKTIKHLCAIAIDLGLMPTDKILQARDTVIDGVKGQGMTRHDAARIMEQMSKGIPYRDSGEFETNIVIEAYDIAIAALRSEDLLPCWHCRGIEAHKIAYVTAVKDKSGRMLNTPIDTPYNYCPACGRKLGVEG